MNKRDVILDGPTIWHPALGRELDCDYDLTIGYRYLPEYDLTVNADGRIDISMEDIMNEYENAVCVAYEFVLRKFENMEVANIITYSRHYYRNQAHEDMIVRYDDVSERYNNRSIWLHGGYDTMMTKQMINDYNPTYSKMNVKPVDGIDKQTNDGMLDIGPQNSFTIPLTYKNGRLVKDVPRKPLNPECVVPYEVYADAWNDTDTSDAHFRDVTIDVNNRLDEAIVTKNVKPVYSQPLVFDTNVKQMIQASHAKRVTFKNDSVRKIDKKEEAEYWAKRWY